LVKCLKGEYRSYSPQFVSCLVTIKQLVQNVDSLQYASEAVKKDGHSFGYASDELKNNKDVVIEAVKNNGHSLQFASEELRKDKEE
jgi:hypothetical protein